MSEKKPDTPVVHLPWSHWEALTARLDALEAAVFKLPPKQDVAEVVNRALRDANQPAAAPPPPAAAPDVIERMRVALDDARAQIDRALRDAGQSAAAPPPPAAPCADEVEVVARALVESSGFGWYDDPMEGGQDAFDICEDAKGDARRVLAALAPLRQAERERARADAIEDAARVAEWSHMVLPDGGSPTEAEHDVAKEAARRIRALAPAPAAEVAG